MGFLLLPDAAHTTAAVKMARLLDLRSSITAACLLVLSLSITLLPPAAGAGATASLVTTKCDNGTYYAANSTYQSNVRLLLASLAANASRSPYPAGFATAVVGASLDTVWGLGLCRGDTVGADCAFCLALAPGVAFNKCQGVKDVSVFYDRCVLRYSFRDFLTSPDNGQVQDRGISDVTVLGNASWFDALVARLVGTLADWAAFNTTARYAVGTMSSEPAGFPATDKSVVHTIYGLVQCTPDQSPAACRRCLQALVDEIPAVFNGTVGGRILAVWCYLRFETHEFFDTTPMLNLVAPPPPSPASADQAGGDGTRWRQYAGTVSAIVLGVAVVLLSVSAFFLWRNGRTRLSYQEDDDHDASLLFDLATLRRATDDFAEENKLGHGGFGAVYKGLLPDGRQIAVKRMDKASGQGLKELRNELLLVAKLRHNNLAKLLGVCLQGQEKLLVYDYLPNRSLDTFLFAAEVEKRLLLDWETRYRIIYGTARGLVYLHEDSQIKIIHRDLKASNILLDDDMSPKISDFGLARLFNGDKTTTITSQVVGTLGYMAPEYAVLGHLSVKLDVYSFGVLILEIVTGRRNTDMSESASDESGSLLTYVWDHWLKGTTLDIVDPSMDCRVPESEVLKCIHLALLCVQENPADRPSMLDVLVMLHDQASSFAAPSKPAFAYGVLSSVRSWDSVSGETCANRGPSATLLSCNEMSVSEFQPR
ncbi:unnamed protein product [Urochloa decumbens]|uniref:Uncharacterized protein n=2 Tax=Urochloa decumbens TaxID=240449 RepID=A0ABC8YJR6_9POAL